MKKLALALICLLTIAGGTKADVITARGSIAHAMAPLPNHYCVVTIYYKTDTGFWYGDDVNGWSDAYGHFSFSYDTGGPVTACNATVTFIYGYSVAYANTVNGALNGAGQWYCNGLIGIGD